MGPSRVRYLVLMLTTLVAVILYLDRICLSFAERYIKEDLRITDTQMALVLSSFFWSYAIGQLPAGWLADRYGARLMLALYLTLWSAFTGFLGLAQGLLLLVVMRLGCGLSQAGAYPASAGLISIWLPFHRRGFGSGIVSLGGRLGGAAAPILTAYLMVAFVPVSTSSLLTPRDLLDPALSITSDSPVPDARAALARHLLGRLPAELVASITKGAMPDVDRLVTSLNKILDQEDLIHGVPLADLDLPAEALRLAAPAANPPTAEQIQRRNRLLLEAAFPDAIRKVYGAGWRPVMAVYGIAGVVLACIFWWLFRNGPRLHPSCNAAEIALIEGAATHAGSRAAHTPLPFTYILASLGLWLNSLVQFLTNFGWVFLVTWFPRYLKEVHDVPLVERGWLTSLPIFVGMFGMFAGGWLTDALAVKLGRRWGRSVPIAVSRFVVAAAFAACMFLQTPWPATIALCVVALATDLGTPAMWAYSLDVGGKHVGSVLGWCNMFGNLGAAVSPIVLNMIIGDDLNYQRMFLACAAAFVVAGILALFIDATKPVVPV